MSPKRRIVKARFQVLESENLELREKLQWSTPEDLELQRKIVVAEDALQKGQVWIKDFSELVEYSFILWNHLQNPLEIGAINKWIRAAKRKVAQQKRKLTFLPPGEQQAVMTAIASKSKEITAARVKQ